MSARDVQEHPLPVTYWAVEVDHTTSSIPLYELRPHWIPARSRCSDNTPAQEAAS